MNKEMIVSSNGHETMVAILEDDLVAEIFVERERHRGVVGNCGHPAGDAPRGRNQIERKIRHVGPVLARFVDHPIVPIGRRAVVVVGNNVDASTVYRRTPWKVPEFALFGTTPRSGRCCIHKQQPTFREEQELTPVEPSICWEQP